MSLNLEYQDLDISGWINVSHRIARQKGWHEKPRSPLELAALFHTEISEFTEACREGLPPIAYSPDESGKPEGPVVELADTLIRIFDACGANGWDLQKALVMKTEYNKTREHRHGGKLY